MKKKEKPKTIPLFVSESDEAAFWDSADSTDYFSGEGKIRLKLPMRTSSISVRLPNTLLRRLKRIAQIKDVPYQSLLKIYLDEKVRQEIATLKKVA